MERKEHKKASTAHGLLQTAPVFVPNDSTIYLQYITVINLSYEYNYIMGPSFLANPQKWGGTKDIQWKKDLCFDNGKPVYRIILQLQERLNKMLEMPEDNRIRKAVRT